MTQEKQTWLANLEQSIADEIIRAKSETLAVAVANERLEQAQIRAEQLEEKLHDVTTILAELKRMSGACASAAGAKTKLPPLRLFNPVSVPHSKERPHYDA
jgi:exo-beta-1,3-glucanase (GH17 family)